MPRFNINTNQEEYNTKIESFMKEYELLCRNHHLMIISSYMDKPAIAELNNDDKEYLDEYFNEMMFYSE